MGNVIACKRCGTMGSTEGDGKHLCMALGGTADQLWTTSGHNMALLPLRVLWKPQKDITVYELALALRYYGIPIYQNTWDAMPEGVRRHFFRTDIERV